jgi:hypothetical protein
MANQEERVMARRSARVVTMEEADTVNGSFQTTATVCTFVPKSGPDGDVTLGECH